MVIHHPEVDRYFDDLPEGRKEALETLRELIFTVVPDVEENFKYRMPTYFMDGESLCAMASQKNYISLYMDVELVEMHKGELDHLDTGKSCIRFRNLEQLPLDTVEAILRETMVRARLNVSERE